MTLRHSNEAASRRGLYLWATLATLCLICGAQPAKSDPLAAKGEALSQLICSACHIVAAKQEFTPILREPTPSFEEIAQRPTTNEKSLQAFLKSTHWDGKSVPITMPDPELTPEQRLALARYIMSLRH